MCEFCIKHGEGKKWYLQAKNYAEDLLSERGSIYVYKSLSSLGLSSEEAFAYVAQRFQRSQRKPAGALRNERKATPRRNSRSGKESSEQGWSRNR